MNGSQVKVGVYGLGYVGCVSAVCMAWRGFDVIGVDVNADKMDSLRQGRSPVVEAKIGELTAEVVASGKLTVSSDFKMAVASTDISSSASVPRPRRAAVCRPLPSSR